MSHLLVAWSWQIKSWVTVLYRADTCRAMMVMRPDSDGQWLCMPGAGSMVAHAGRHADCRPPCHYFQASQNFSMALRWLSGQVNDPSNVAEPPCLLPFAWLLFFPVHNHIAQCEPQTCAQPSCNFIITPLNGLPLCAQAQSLQPTHAALPCLGCPALYQMATSQSMQPFSLQWYDHSVAAPVPRAAPQHTSYDLQ